jgi:hypothetical protein
MNSLTSIRPRSLLHFYSFLFVFETSRALSPRQIIDGMDVVLKIEGVNTDEGDKPLVPVVMNSVTISS